MIAVLEMELATYRTAVIRRLQERLDESVVVYHSPPASGKGLRTVSPGEEVGFAHEVVPGLRPFGSRVFLANSLRVLEREPRAVIVRHQYLLRNPMAPLLVAACRLRHVPLIGWGHGYSRRRPFRPTSRLLDRCHLAVIRVCDAYLCYTEEARLAITAFVPEEKLFAATNTLDTDSLFALRRSLERRGKAAVREDLGLRENRRYLCFIGRLHPRKRLDVLLEACAIIKRDAECDLGLLVVGDGDMRNDLERRARQLGIADDVVFAGEQYGDQAAKYLFASDIMAMPGALGLAVVHALALGIPVVSQHLGPDLVGHGPEAACIQEDVNGRMADSGGSRELATALIAALNGQERLSRGAVEFAEENLTLDRMVDGFVAAIDHATP